MNVSQHVSPARMRSSTCSFSLRYVNHTIIRKSGAKTRQPRNQWHTGASRGSASHSSSPIQTQEHSTPLEPEPIQQPQRHATSRMWIAVALLATSCALLHPSEAVASAVAAAGSSTVSPLAGIWNSSKRSHIYCTQPRERDRQRQRRSPAVQLGVEDIMHTSILQKHVADVIT